MNRDYKAIKFVGVFLVILLSYFMIKYNYIIFPKDLIGKKADYLTIEKDCMEYKDFVYTNEGKEKLYSLSINPWIIMKDSANSQCVYFQFDINKLKRKGAGAEKQQGQIYGIKDGVVNPMSRTFFTLEDGKNIVRVNNFEAYDAYRIDLVSNEDIEIEINSITFADHFRVRWLLPILIVDLLLTIIIIYVMSISSEKKEDIEKRVMILMDKIFESVNGLIRKQISFVKQNKLLILFTFIGGLLCYGILISYYTIYIDEERQIMEDYATSAWLTQGRYMNFLFEKYILKGKIYTSYLGDLVAMILLCISSLVHCFNISLIRKQNGKLISQVVFTLLCISMPYVCGGYMLVGIYNIEMSLALCLVAISMTVIFSDDSVKWQRYIFAVLLLFVAISIYQAFAPLYITCTVLYTLCVIVFTSNTSVKEIIKKDFVATIILIISLILYSICNKIALYVTGIIDSGYLSSNFMGWNAETSVIDIIKQIFVGIFKIYSGSYEMILGGEVVSVTIAFFVFYSICRMLDKEAENKVLYFIIAVLLLISPFSLLLVTGSTNFAGRTLQGLPLVIGFVWYVFLEKTSKYKLINFVVSVYSVYLVFCQVQYINQYFLADYKRYEQDKIITEQIISDIRQVTAGNYNVPIVFHGAYYHDDSNLTTSYENAGSFYCVDGGSNTRIIHFMQAQGYEVKMPSAEQIVEAEKYVPEMTTWPYDGSVYNQGEFIVIKLSE